MSLPEEQPNDPIAEPKYDQALIENVQVYLRCRSSHLKSDAGSKGAWDKFYSKCSVTLRAMAIICHVTPGDLDEVVEDAWDEVVERLPDFRWRDAKAFCAWLFTLVHHEAVNRVRDKRRHPAKDLNAILGTKQEPLDPAEGPAAAWERKHRCELVGIVMEQLRKEVPDQKFQVLALRLQGCTVSEIMDKLGLTRTQVWDRQHSMFQKLRDAWQTLTGEQFGPGVENENP